MLIIRYFMLLLIFLLSLFIGKNLSKRYVYRLNELEEIKNTLNILKVKIKFTYEPIPEIFEEIAKNLKDTNESDNISKLFIDAREKMNNNSAGIAWEQAIDEYDGYLKISDKQTIKTLSKLLRIY